MVFFQEKIAWTPEVKKILAPAMANDPLNSILSIEQEVLTGNCQVIAGYEDNKIAVAFVVRIDKQELGQELVIVCGASKSHNMTKQCVPEFRRLAKKYDCEYIRIHTALKALGRILIHNQFELSEMVFRQRVL